MSNSGIIVNTHIFVGPTSGHVYIKLALTTLSFSPSSFSFLRQHSLSLSLPSFCVLLSPSPSSKPTFIHKFFTPFSLVLSLLLPFLSEEQRYLSEAIHLKENPET